MAKQGLGLPSRLCLADLTAPDRPFPQNPRCALAPTDNQGLGPVAFFHGPLVQAGDPRRGTTLHPQCFCSHPRPRGMPG